MKLAARVSRIAPSPTLAMAATAKAMAAQGLDIVDFSTGEPDFDTPEPVKAAAEAAIRAGFTKYTPSSRNYQLNSESGMKSLRSWCPAAPNIRCIIWPKRYLKQGMRSSFPRHIGSPTRIKPS